MPPQVPLSPLANQRHDAGTAKEPEHAERLQPDQAISIQMG